MANKALCVGLRYSISSLDLCSICLSTTIDKRISTAECLGLHCDVRLESLPRLWQKKPVLNVSIQRRRPFFQKDYLEVRSRDVELVMENVHFLSTKRTLSSDQTYTFFRPNVHFLPTKRTLSSNQMSYQDTAYTHAGCLVSEEHGDQLKFTKVGRQPVDSRHGFLRKQEAMSAAVT